MSWPRGYTLCFIQRQNEMLLLNRVKAPNLGLWNGVGGKIDHDETAVACVLREVLEETAICLTESQLVNQCLVKWNNADDTEGHMHVYLARVPDDFDYLTPVLRTEGILAWKSIEWILQKNNQGIAKTIPYFLPSLMNSQTQLCHCFHFVGEEVTNIRHTVTDWAY